MAADTLDALRDYAQAIDAAMAQFFVELPSLLNLELSSHSQAAVEYLRDYSTRPGKRIRGSLASITYDHATGGHLEPIGLQLGVAMELIQNYLLIVDDVMDKSDSRRGQPTLHKLYDQEASGFGGEHAANMLAINVGLLAQHFSNLVLARLDVPPAVLAQAFTAMHVNISATGFGQLDDLFQQLGREVSEADIIGKYRSKSSYYTFVNPLQLGFILADKATPEVLAACRTFGEAAGIAFQLHDDYLGIFGDPKLLGKPNLDDIREGKYTILVQRALTHTSAADVQVLEGILGNSGAGNDDLQTVQRIMIGAGAQAHNQALAQHYVQAAKEELARETIGDPAFRQLLGGLVDYATERQR